MHICENFDSVSRDFTFKVLRRFEFSDLLYSLFSNIFNLAHTSVLINGSAKGYLKCSRRVRQKNPLSLLLFGIAEDYLGKLLLWKIVDSSSKLISTSQGLATPSHLLF